MVILENILSINFEFLHTFGYLILFLATFLESVPLAGLFIPGSITIFIAGFLSHFQFVQVSVMDFWLVVTIAALGEILGGTSAYLFGRFAGKEFLSKYGKIFLIKREYIEKAGEIACNHAGKSLILGRFHPVTRSAAPFIVGCHKVPFTKFIFYNIIGGAIWVFLFAELGYIFGQSYSFAQRFEKYLIVFTVGVIILLYAIYFIKLIIEKRKVTKITKVGECVSQWPG